MPRLTDVVKNLLLLNVVFFLAVLLDDAAGRPLNLNSLLALYYPGSDRFLPVQLVTHFFMHADVMHLFFNMFVLIMFGPPLEALWGAKRFLFFYIVCALGSAALHIGWNYWELSSLQATIDQFAANPSLELFNAYVAEMPLGSLTMDGGNTAAAYVSSLRTEMIDDISAAEAQTALNFMEQYQQVQMGVPAVGASGAIYGIMTAFAMQFPNLELQFLFIPIPIKAKYMVTGLLLVSLFLGVQRFAGDNIAHFAHLGGALAGFLLILYWRKFSPNP